MIKVRFNKIADHALSMAESRDELIARIIDLYASINHAMRQLKAEPWMELDLTIAQLKSLVFISHEGSTNPKNLAMALGVTPSNVTGIVDRLIEQGLVNRREDPQDRRMLRLRSTEKGEALLTGLREKAIAGLSSVLAKMSSEELSVLVTGLSSFAHAIEVNAAGQNGDHP
jgi:DNA-binding MarR family transcriptional regulator